MFGYGWMGDMMDGYGRYGGYGPLGGVAMLIFWIVVIVAVVYVARTFVSPGRDGRGRIGSEQSSPLDILRERYAKGEIDKKEFEEKKRDLAE